MRNVLRRSFLYIAFSKWKRDIYHKCRISGAKFTLQFTKFTMIATKVEPSHEKSLNSHTAESGQALVFSVIVTDSLPAGFTANTVSE